MTESFCHNTKNIAVKMRLVGLCGILMIICCVQNVENKAILRWHPDFPIPGTYFANRSPEDQPYYTANEDIGWSIVAVAQLVDDVTGNLIKYDGSPSIKSVSKKVWDAAQNNITLVDDYTGRFCIADFWLRRSYQRWENWRPSWKQCDDNWIYMYKGEVWIRRIYHDRGEFTGDDQRFIQVSLSYINTDLVLNSLPFDSLGLQYLPNGLQLVEPLPLTVVANNPFLAKLRVVNSDGYQINDTQYSTWETMSGVSYIHKLWNRRNSLWLEETDCVLSGPGAVHHVTNDIAIFKNLVGGRVDIEMSLEDIFVALQLNFTLKKKYAPFRRFPEEEMHPVASRMETYELFKSFFTDEARSNSSHIRYQNYDPVDYFRGVLLATITVTAQVPHTFRIISGHSFIGNQGISHQIKKPIQVELIDQNGYRVTSGPDSSLAVTTLSDYIDTCISTDSHFTLVRGIGTFPGSICIPIETTSLKFKVTTSIGELSTNATATFKVVGKWNWFSSTGTVQELNLMSSALYYASGTYWLGSRHPYIYDYKTLTEIIDACKSSKENTEENIVAMIGPSNDKDTDVAVAVAGVNDYLFISYTNTETKYSDSKRYPNFIRVTYADSYRYALIANIIANRNWNKIVVVATLNIPLPDEFVVYMSLFEIKYEVAFFPMKGSLATQSEIDTFFEAVEDAKLSILFSFLKADSLQMMVAEATKRNFTALNGYTWIGEDNMIKDFPYNNSGPCSGLTAPTCVEAFRGTMLIETHYTVHGFSDGNFNWVTIAYGELFSTVFKWQGEHDEKVKAALAWDAISATIAALVVVSSNKETIILPKIREYIRTTASQQSLTGKILYDEDGNRRNYTATLFQIDAMPGDNNKTTVLKKKRFLFLGDDVTPKNIQKNNSIREITVVNEQMIYRTVPDDERNKITYSSVEGTMNDDLSLNGPLEYIKNKVTENIPPAFYCTGGCGGKLLDDSDRTKWEYGTCLKQDTCKCELNPDTGNPGYSGPNCNTIVCDGCLFGTCVSPGNCSCDPGYINSENMTDCGVPTCLTDGCSQHGVCTAADYCKCEPNYYGKDCSKICDCENGKCSDGNSGNGACSCDSGYIGEKCSTHTVAIALPIVLGLIAIFVLLFLVGRWKYRQVQLHAQLMSTDWKVDWESIRMRQKRQKSSMKSLMSMVSMMSAKSANQEEKVVCKNQGTWNGKEIVVKSLRKNDVELTDELRWEVKQMKDIKHPNLCLFIGACLESPHVSILNELCGKGSLEDILSNDSVDLGWDFRYSMLKDICRGMTYLSNSEISSHGRLKSSNCLVDNRWTVKISDYGMKSFRANQLGVRAFSLSTGAGVQLPTEDEMEECDYYNLLWTSPEILETGVSHPNHVGYGTAKGDIYSMAMIMVEMCTRYHPYHELDYLGPEKIVQMLGRLIPVSKNLELVECKDSDKVPIRVLRPKIDEVDLPADEAQATGYSELVQSCWNHDPVLRPTFSNIQRQLNTISPHRGELMDNLIILMEQYTNSLESIVAERTMHLKEEKEKSDLLLTRMLPPLIAEELKSGNNPKPEYFSCVTIYFSDVVGFGKMCAACTPYEVVDLLNDLYSVMDDVIESFDCYKVETIADCYVVVSGLPTRNGDQHAGEIASMSLQLLSSLNGIGYRHLAGSQVQLRIGIHSGPVVAGVVGIKMPRYCLFGDTVNTSSRMESGGFALKIHLSEDTFKILEGLGGYQVECRGERQVKGRGTMTTYWLTGKDDADYNLPSEDLALSRSQHDFK